jgi:allophanate hydrolase subunit 2
VSHTDASEPYSSGEVTLRATAGPRADWFAPEALVTLAGASFQVTAASNRTGLRLDGPLLGRVSAAELPSEGVATGSLQVSHDGLAILLLADHPTTGGYPVIAVVHAADVGRAAQLRPGQRIRFALDP